MSEDAQFDPDKLLDELFDESVYARARTERPFLSAETLQEPPVVDLPSKPAPLWRVIGGGTLALVWVAALQVRAAWQTVRRLRIWRALVTACMVWLALVQMLLTVIAGAVALVKRGLNWLVGF